MFTYDGETKKYIQKPLVWAQVLQLAQILEGFEFAGMTNPSDIITLLKEKVYPALAVVLREEDKPLREKDLAAFEEELTYELPLTKVVDVIKDFFVCNPISSLLDEVAGVVKQLTPEQEVSEKLLEEPSSSSLEGT